MKLDVVVHCWQYARLLCYHLSSFWFNPPESDKLKVSVHVVHADDDEAVKKTLTFFLEQYGKDSPVNLFTTELPRNQVCRRTIGRNMLALSTEADWVWFADCDYVVGPKGLDALEQRLAECPPDVSLAYPGRVMASTTQADGDALINAIDEPKVVSIKNGHFSSLKYFFAIGGVQFVRGDYCREHGYLKDSKKYMRQASSWIRTFEDVPFRYACGKTHRFEISDLYRIRHSVRGGFDKGTIVL